VNVCFLGFAAFYHPRLSGLDTRIYKAKLYLYKQNNHKRPIHSLETVA